MAGGLSGTPPIDDLEPLREPSPSPPRSIARRLSGSHPKKTQSSYNKHRHRQVGRQAGRQAGS